MIPNLVNVTQAYAKQEKELISLLMRSRQAYLQATAPKRKVVATVQVNPQLQSSQLFTNLQYELTGI